MPFSTALLANGYAILAFSIWPGYASLATMLVEPDRLRRLVTAGLFALGVVVSVYGAIHIAAHPYAACIVGHSISYSDGAPYSHLMFGVYLVSGGLPLLLSSHKAVRWFGLIVLVGLLVAWLFYFKTRSSVWCFFAALASATIYWHFAMAQRPLVNKTTVLGNAAQ